MTPEEQRLEIARLDHADLNREVADRLKYQIDFALAGLKGLTLINGGAIVALFTVIGNKGLPVDPRWIWWAFASFSIGLTLAVATYLTAFLSQMFYMYSSIVQMWSKQAEMLGNLGNEEHVAPFQKGKRAEVAAIVLAFMSLVAFMAGALNSLLAVLP